MRAFAQSCLSKIKKFPSDLKSLYKDHVLSSSITAALDTSKAVRSPNKEVFPGATSRPFAPLSRFESNHVRQSKSDLITAAPIAVLAALPIVGYGAMVGAFVIPRYTLSRQFFDADERWQFALEDVKEREKFYPQLCDAVGKHVKMDAVAEALALYRTLEDSPPSDGKHLDDDRMKYIQEVLAPFREGRGLCFNSGLSRNDLVALSASRGFSRLHTKDFGGVLNACPSNMLRRMLMDHAIDVKTDDFLIHAEKLLELSSKASSSSARQTLNDDDLRDANSFRGLTINRDAVDKMFQTLHSHVSIVGREAGFLDDSKTSSNVVTPSLVLFLPALLPMNKK